MDPTNQAGLIFHKIPLMEFSSHSYAVDLTPLCCASTKPYAMPASSHPFHDRIHILTLSSSLWGPCLIDGIFMEGWRGFSGGAILSTEGIFDRDTERIGMGGVSLHRGNFQARAGGRMPIRRGIFIGEISRGRCVLPHRGCAVTQTRSFIRHMSCEVYLCQIPEHVG